MKLWTIKFGKKEKKKPFSTCLKPNFSADSRYPIRHYSLVLMQRFATTDGGADLR